jgi:DNA-directed RNA polymerase specialized sigma24 family protein
MMQAQRETTELGDDAFFIERSWDEPEQFAVLFDRHAPRIHRYVARRIGREMADDVVAETFLAAFAKRRRYFMTHRDAAPWLYGIATNLVGQHRRDEARQFRIRQTAMAELDVPGHADRVAADVTAGMLAIPAMEHGTVVPGQHMTDAFALVKSEVVSKLPPDAAATLRAALQARMKAVLKPKAAK